MLKHVVMWKLKETAGGRTGSENARILKQRLEALAGLVPEIRSIEVGVNTKSASSAYDAVLISTFADEEALEAYKKHPEHVKVSTFCKSVRDERVEVDFYVGGE